MLRAPACSRICCHDSTMPMHCRQILPIDQNLQKKSDVRRLDGSSACAGPVSGTITETAFAAGEGGSVGLGLSCFFWCLAALSFSISFSTVVVGVST